VYDIKNGYIKDLKVSMHENTDMPEFYRLRRK
jgi:hypothetical protein